MKKSLLLLYLLLVTFVSKAEYKVVDIKTTLTYTSYIIEYTSVGPDGVTPATVSGAITVPTSFIALFKDVWVLDSHHTIADSKSAPSVVGSTQAGSTVLSGMAVVIAPDYYGFGSTQDKPHPYLCQFQNARNSLDLVKVALEFLPTKGFDPFMLCNIGYSQGGGVAMAAHNLLETDSEYSGIADRFKGGLHSWFGDGPYDPVTTAADLYAKADYVIFPALLPMIIQGFLCGAPAELTEGLKFSDFFTETMNTPTTVTLESGTTFDYPGLEALLAAKELDNDKFNAVMRAVTGGKSSLADFFSADMCNQESDIYKKVEKWMESNSACTGWKPKKEMFIYNLIEDDIVTSANGKLAFENFGIPASYYKEQHETDFNFSTEQGNHYQYGVEFFKSFAVDLAAVYLREITDIESIQDSAISNGLYYDLEGRPAGNNYRGIFIRDGKKVFVR